MKLCDSEVILEAVDTHFVGVVDNRIVEGVRFIFPVSIHEKIAGSRYFFVRVGCRCNSI